MEPKLKEKRWDPGFEKELFEQWEKEELYKFDRDSGKPIYSIDTPPVYPSGEWHIGAVSAYALNDMIARKERMCGKEVLFPFCLDRNGINIELTVEKKYNKALHEFGREEFLTLCQEAIEGYSKDILGIAKTIGMSADFGETFYMTDSPEYRTITQATFIDLWNKGLIYEDYRPNNYCAKCGTTIADAEIYYEEIPSSLNYVRFKAKETGEELLIATTRPELLCACQAVLVNPDDERYKHLHGKHATIPIYNRDVPIKPHPYAKPEFGTGVLMVCSYGDSGDIALFRELQLEPINAIDEKARMTAEAGKYQGMTVKEARKAIIDNMKHDGILSKQEQSTHRTPICERSKTSVEFVSMKEWYIKQLDFLDDLRALIPKMKFHPDANKQVLINWIDSVTMDWPVSRRRYYHTEIPIWYCKSNHHPNVPEPGKYYQPWKDKPPFKKCSKCDDTEFVGEERVFDTWVDSSISNLFVCGYLRDDELFKMTYPCSLRPQGRDIVRTWLFYTLLRNKQLTDSKAFEHVWIHGMGLDEHGKKMSKSRGNVVHPRETLEEFGADTFRFWAAGETNIGDDFRISRDRMAGASKFLTKFWNIARFISSFPQAEKPAEIAETDKWILTKLRALVKECALGYDDLNSFVPASKVREFVWNLYAPHYIEMAKARAYAGDASALFTLHRTLKILLRLLAPITPFITDKIYRELYGDSVHLQKLPQGKKVCEAAGKDLTDKIVEFNSKIWKEKKGSGNSLNTEIKKTVPEALSAFKYDLIKMHRIV